MNGIKQAYIGFIDKGIYFLTLMKRRLDPSRIADNRLKSVFIKFCGFIILMSVYSCKSTETNKATDLINKSIQAHGGFDQWKSLDTMIYKKKITLYNRDKEVRKYIEQQHNYSLSAELKGSYSYYDSINYEVIFDGTKAYKTENSVPNSPDASSFNNFNSAYYVLNMPWKLLDEGAHATYEGIDTLFDGQIVEHIKVKYTSGTSKDTWWYYFNPSTYRVVACLVHHPPTYNLITNDEYTNYQGLLWNHKRSSYRADEYGDIIYLMGKYEYVYGEGEE